MAKFVAMKGLKEYELKLSKLGADANKVAKMAVYDGAAIMADEIRKGIEGLPIVSGYGTEKNPLPGGVTKSQKQGLLDGMGIAQIETTDGYVNTKIGFDGYNSTKTEKYPQGQPNQLVARGVESGTSWKQAHPFIKSAISRARKRVEKKMAETLEEEIERRMK